jgi:class 3 adenylate cyclase
MSQDGRGRRQSNWLASHSLGCTLHDHERKQWRHADIFGDGVNIAARLEVLT